ncbi:MAG: SlyX family protein [Pirellulales bacterium]|nr:SlyX family protein [Pirellulales bacterium]
MPDESKLHERVTKLEMVFMHLEETVHALDEVVRAQQKALDAIDARLARLACWRDADNNSPHSPGEESFEGG